MMRFKHWLIRLPDVPIAAACMGWLGLILMVAGTPYFPSFGDFWTRYLLLASLRFAGIGCDLGALSYCLSKRRLQEWLAWGFLSPMLGGLLVAPPASFAFITVKGYIAFPVGIDLVDR